MATPFDNILIRNWFASAFTKEYMQGWNISTVGSEPFEEAEFDGFLKELGIELNYITADNEILVIGQTGWDEAALLDLLDRRKGKTLKVYSQEMFLTYIIAENDPFDHPHILQEFGKGHPALEFLADNGFDWPTTFVTLGDGPFDVKFPAIGLLAYLGYKVGVNGLGPAARRKILLDVFYSTSLPKVNSEKYMREWGEAMSAQRLKKMADSIASFCRNHKRKANYSMEAINDWESDLEWLKTHFYTGRFSFNWPSMYVY